MANSIKVRVPGTTANCGPGFDAVGIACTIYNDLELTLCDQNGISLKVKGEGAGYIPADESNVVVRAVKMVLNKTGHQAKGLQLNMVNHIPLARGLGSSAAAIVGGLVAANELTGRHFSKEELLEMATAIEGHPDNVAPAILGGITVSIMECGKVKYLRFLPPVDFLMVAVIPEFNLSTRAARKVLPQTVPFPDAVFNVSRTALLIGALCTGELKLLLPALEDKLHQPYREPLIPGMTQVLAAARQAGALGSALSGAGPCLLAFANENADEIGKAMVQAFNVNKVKAKYQILQIDRQGAIILS
ncbi:homoserine kinase [Sporomusa acidovorans]|uniref:Homoserine kinase n=1 Tax=Sporomusa acidovorans (strain ATCC 49682 / DSM 3132 / Mol) TaxID=1123286 RepID=A0ABZ3J3I1_SPOA4|nr:homoserine kinase [Sporomusa acidovorans]OZC20295.1 homoserine kinase [Sporomusa acidovorans DSM 3132]SDD38934.1 homoserine kinase [Sporomusa acidovorans]